MSKEDSILSLSIYLFLFFKNFKNFYFYFASNFFFYIFISFSYADVKNNFFKIKNIILIHF
jgi:hypothetical protein